MLCRLCPRKCKVNRMLQKGFCVSGEKIKIARAALHYWEEPCISGEGGAGAVFFSGCNLRCRYCQNLAISRGEAGAEISAERLKNIFFELEEQGAETLDLVTPTHYIDIVYDVVMSAKKEGMRLPVVYNCGGYEDAEVLTKYAEAFDVYMPDFKYMDEKLSKELSECHNYPEVAKIAISKMFRLKGPVKFNEHGIMTSGVIVRHLVLPGQMNNSKRVLTWLFENFGNEICYSIMSQYTPVNVDQLDDYPDLKKPLKRTDYEEILNLCDDLGIENGFIQEEGTDSDSFIPEFDLFGVFPKENVE